MEGFGCYFGVYIGRASPCGLVSRGRGGPRPPMCATRQTILGLSIFLPFVPKAFGFSCALLLIFWALIRSLGVGTVRPHFLRRTQRYMSLPGEHS